MGDRRLEGCPVAHQDDSGGDRNRRLPTHRTSSQDEETSGNPYHRSKGIRAFVGIVALILVITMTSLFVMRVVQW
jgi:hypothetical protein